MQYIDINMTPLARLERHSSRSKPLLPAGGVSLPPGFERSPSIVALGSDRPGRVGLLRQGRALALSIPHRWLAPQPLSSAARRGRAYPKAIATALKSHGTVPQYAHSSVVTHPVQIYPVQSHHAQIAACLVEHHWPLDAGPVLGLAFDEPAHGEDGMVWGGEFFRADYHQVQRLATLKPVPMLGNERAIAEPWRNTYAHLISAFDWDDVNAVYGQLELIQFLHAQPRILLNQLLITGAQAPKTSSVSRWFDAVAAAIGLHREAADYGGQGGDALEQCIQPADWSLAERSPYPFSVDKMRTRTGQRLPYLDPRPMWHALLEDLSQGEPISLIAARFKVGLGNAIADLAMELAQGQGLTHVALVGSMVNYPRLTQLITQRLISSGYTVLKAPLRAQAAQVLLGQLAVGAARTLNGASEETLIDPEAVICS
ncbi:MAG: hypothetical protein EA367_04615 [Leptolyngbya sp. DLM2.Bin15]|nr:MAG: hypothetical protein EA367_04615 [Leptolyngbya sp. DLM2.Bin15]